MCVTSVISVMTAPNLFADRSLCDTYHTSAHFQSHLKSAKNRIGKPLSQKSQKSHYILIYMLSNSIKYKGNL